MNHGIHLALMLVGSRSTAAALGTQLPLPATQVWVVAELRDGKLYWKADSDSQLTKVGGWVVGGWGAARWVGRRVPGSLAACCLAPLLVAAFRLLPQLVCRR